MHHIIIYKLRLSGWLYLGEVADEVATFAVILGEDVEKEGLHIIVEGLVVQEQLGQQTQVLTVDCAHIPINLFGRNNENNNISITKHQQIS